MSDKPTDVPARPAATALILRDGDDGIEVFMVVRHHGAESTEGFWIRPAEALRDAREGRRSIVPATRLNLQKLAVSTTVVEAVAAARASSIVTVMPKVQRNPDGSRTLQIPAEAGYGLSEMFIPAGERTAAGR